jgi:hypothetical protein
MSEDVRLLLPTSDRCESDSNDVVIFSVTSYLPPKDLVYIDRLLPSQIELHTIPYADFLLGKGFDKSEYYKIVETRYGVKPFTRDARQLIMLLATQEYFANNSKFIASQIVTTSREAEITKSAKTTYEKEVKATEAANKRIDAILGIVDRASQYGPVQRALQ